jgi:hypothetical protein
MIIREPTPTEPGLEAKLVNSIDELRFRTDPSYQEVRYRSVPSKCAKDEFLSAKATYEHGQLDGYITLTSGASTLTFTKQADQEIWTISGLGGGLVDSRDVLAYVQNVLQTSVLRPEFAYMNRIDVNDKLMLRALEDTIGEHARPTEKILSYTHSILVGTPDGGVAEDEGVTLGTVTKDDETFYFATVVFPCVTDPSYTMPRHNGVDVIHATPGSRIPITVRVELHPGRPAEYSAYYHNPDTGELQVVGIPGGEAAAAELLTAGIRDFLDSL